MSEIWKPELKGKIWNILEWAELQKREIAI